MDEVREARERLDAILRGRYVPRRLTPEEAKRRLMETDPGIDISDALSALREGDLSKAAQNLLYQSLAPETVAFFAPLIAEALRGFAAAGGMPRTPEKEPD
jgi:hypothetical protein